MESDLFHPYRSLGLVSNDLPLVVRYIKRRKEHLIITSIGNAFHTYGATKLSLLSVGNPQPSKITCLSADAYHIYTATNSTIYAWRRGTELKHRYNGHEGLIHIIMPFGPHLISVDSKNTLIMWDIKDESIQIQKSFSINTTVTCLLHPATYLNKILIGTKQGKLILMNLKTNQDIYKFNGWNSEVTVLEQAPALDVVAIGLSDGRIILHNLKFDETIVEFKQDYGTVTALSFRTDGVPILASGSKFGHIAIWDLEKRKLSSQIRDAHKNTVSGMKFLSNEPILVTSSSDNSLKMWIFDSPDGGARLLKFREGHYKPPLSARFHGSLGDTILTGGEDSVMRMFNTTYDVACKSFGQASYIKKVAKKKKASLMYYKMPPITQFTAETSQEKSWDNIGSIHRHKAVVTTWSVHKQKMGEHKLIHKRFNDLEFKKAYATCLELTMCGNYIIIGYSSGHMDKYNIQSGLFRGSFGNPTAHEDSLMGVATDGLNQYVISGGQEGEIRWWKLKTCRGTQKLVMDHSIVKLRLHRDSGLLAVALDDWSIQLIDSETKVIVRSFYGHSNQVTDLAFTPDSKWIISASLDRSIRTWDLPTGQCVSWFEISTPASSLTVSPISDIIATTHAGHLGICLWVNRSCYTHIPLKPLPSDYQPPLLSLPSTAADEASMPPAEGEQRKDVEIVDNTDDDEYKSPEQINEDLVTLSLLPSSRWLNLLNIDLIKKRNKPIEPPKAPKSAPFFIPSVPGLDFKFGEEPTEEDKNATKIKPITTFEILSNFGKALKAEDYSSAIKMLMEMGPSAIDVEIRDLDPDTGGSIEVMLNFLNMIYTCLKNKRYYEAVEGYLGLFLKVHGEFILNNNNAREICCKIESEHKNIWCSLKSDMDQSLCLLSYFKNATLINC